MIVTVTPNPSLDRTYRVAALEVGELNRASADTVEPSGKGVNVSIALHAAGVATRAVLPAGAALCALLDRADLPYAAVPVAATRTNVTIAEPGRTTKVNAPGEPLADAEWDALVDAVAGAAVGADWVVICGSLPPAAPADAVRRLVSAGWEGGAAVAVDTSGSALIAASRTGPDLLAPNGAELAELTGTALPPAGPPLVAAAGAAARALHAATGSELLVSLGADGALYVGDGWALAAAGPPVEPVNTAGAGDALLAGWLAGDDDDPPTRLARAVAWGTAACLMAATAGDVAAAAKPEAVTVADLDPSSAARS